ncbi:hypothetical protein EDB81DRAFT_861691 [Dactylonectria macrodidyma]|uniref:Protein kinase domain-containing protein n=1 Tax=Dactylonectria macrodidyma TaxID=307937 RepID=A0A9P9IHA5_9HYPO|nr:hypothetical protein EDB81DRAFT_861691 [Dactylonectria macrodidyma]
MLTSTGFTTKPQNKWCPTQLKPWSDFLERQREVFGNLYAAMPVQARAFDGRTILDSIGSVVAKQLISNELMLRHFLNTRYADQICAYLAGDATRNLVHVSEYKPPHKLAAPHLRLGLRPMNTLADVVHRVTVPTNVDPEALFQSHADLLTASAITQTYHYMIEGGVDYGILTTGEAIICSAVGQYLAFTLMALGPPGTRRTHGQDERSQATKVLKKWAVNMELIVRDSPETTRQTQPTSPAWIPTTYDSVDRSPNKPHPKRRRRRRCRGDIAEADILREDPFDSFDEESDPILFSPIPGSRPSASGGQGAQRNRRAREQETHGNHSDEQDREYCTQKFLLGLVKGGFLDRRCPNVALHRDSAQSDSLNRTLDEGITSLGQGGARGVLFKVTLLVYGYNFHEAAVYDRLLALQGANVPVFLGAIDLRTMDKIYYYYHRVYVIHMTFFSWGEHPIRPVRTVDSEGQLLGDKAMQSLLAMHDRGVVHKDVRDLNMLFNPETDGVMMIDFERSLLLEMSRCSLAQTVSKMRVQEEEENVKPTTGEEARDGARTGQTEMDADIWRINLMFLELRGRRE